MLLKCVLEATDFGRQPRVLFREVGVLFGVLATRVLGAFRCVLLFSELPPNFGDFVLQHIVIIWASLTVAEREL